MTGKKEKKKNMSASSLTKVYLKRIKALRKELKLPKPDKDPFTDAIAAIRDSEVINVMSKYTLYMNRASDALTMAIFIYKATKDEDQEFRMLVLKGLKSGYKNIVATCSREITRRKSVYEAR